MEKCANSNREITVSGPVLRRPPAQAYHLKRRPTSDCRTLSDVGPASRELEYETLQRHVTISSQDFSFSDLQRIQFIQEKVNETLLILKINVDVLIELRQHYRSIFESDGWPCELILKCKGDISRFEKRIIAVENDLRMQQSKSETLLRVLADRKSLVFHVRRVFDLCKLISSSYTASWSIEIWKLAKRSLKEPIETWKLAKFSQAKPTNLRVIWKVSHAKCMRLHRKRNKKRSL